MPDSQQSDRPSDGTIEIDQDTKNVDRSSIDAAPTSLPDAQAAISHPAFASMFAAYLKEQKSSKRWRIFFRLSWLGVMVVTLFFLFVPSQNLSNTSAPHTAVVEIKGEIADGANASAAAIVGAIKDAFEDSNAKAVVLLIDSPGGSPVQAGIVNDEIIRMKKLYKKPVYAVVEESCASAAYYIAVAADKIYVDKASIVGSIGVLMDGFGFTGLMEKIGVERRLMTAGVNKGFLDPFSPQSKDQRRYAQTLLNQIHKQFIGVVRQGRGARLKENADTFSGLYWSGEQAIEMGLADEFGNVEYVARDVVQAPDLYDYTRKENVAERLAKRFGMALGEGVVKAMAQQGVSFK